MTVIESAGWSVRPGVPAGRIRTPERLDGVVSTIDSAAEYVVLASFLMSKGAIIDALERAAGRGCRCYVLTAAEEQLRLDRADLTPEDRQLIVDHRLLLDRCQEFAMIRSGSRLHAKAVLVDGPRGAALLSTSNLRDGALVGNDELLIPLEGDELSGLHNLLRWAMFVAAENEMSGSGRLIQVVPRNDVTLPRDGRLMSKTDQGDGLGSFVAARIRDSSGPVVVASYSWSPDHPVVRAMRDAARRGGEVTALANLTVRSSLPAIRELADSGVRVRGREWLHAKAVCAGDSVMVCSSNFRTERLVPSSFDIGVVLEGRRAGEVAAQLSQWVEGATHDFSSPQGLA